MMASHNINQFEINSHTGTYDQVPIPQQGYSFMASGEQDEGSYSHSLLGSTDRVYRVQHQATIIDFSIHDVGKFFTGPER